LAEAGFPEGFEVQLDYMPHKFRSMERVVAAIVSDLAEVGIRVEPRPRETSEFFRIVRERDTAFYLWGWLGNSGDAGITYGYLLHSRGDGFGVANAGGYANPELDALLAQASRTLAIPDRRALLWSAAQIVARDRPLIPLYRQTDVYAMAADLAFLPRPDRRIEADLLRWTSGN
jgi:peptide/nickel transport system substrate-binding protein